MKRLLLILSLVCALAFSATAQSHNLVYEVKWRWGLVDLSAGLAYVNTSLTQDAFSASLTGHSIPWEGRIYKVDETLNANVTPEALNLQYINGVYSKPRVHEQGVETPYRDILGQGTLDASSSTMEAVSVMAHMLGLFYYSGVIDFGSMSPGHFRSIPYNNNSGLESVLQIEYIGETADGYSIKFKFSFCPYHVDCVIDKATLLPTSFSAEIAIGHVEMNLTTVN